MNDTSSFDATLLFQQKETLEITNIELVEGYNFFIIFELRENLQQLKLEFYDAN